MTAGTPRIAEARTAYSFDAPAAHAPAANSDATYHDLFSAARQLLLIYQRPLPQLEGLLDALDLDGRPIERLSMGELLALVARAQAVPA